MNGWVATAAVVAGYDLWAMLTGRETMSSAFWRWLDHPTKGKFCLVAWALVTIHLCVLKEPR